MINSSNRYGEKRDGYYNIQINGEAIWVKKLRSILNSDIHKKPLGCKISDTHVKINKVHLSSFFEAQILFSHAYWIKRFAAELSNIISRETSEEKSILLVGYETYIEPVMFCLKKRLTEEEGFKDKTVNYCIYEEKKFTYDQNIRGENLRYLKSAINSEVMPTCVIFLCGISTTLSTHIKMRDFFVPKYLEELRKQKIEESTVNLKYLSIIQVLPDKKNNSGENKFEISDNEIITWSDKEADLQRQKVNNGVKESETIEVPFIVSVNCSWHKATECELCYPRSVLDEKPIIETSETSVVPMQMIFSADAKEEPEDLNGEKVSSFDFFERDKNGFVFKDYLYYGHIVRGEHHFLYYIRTNHLFADILNDTIKGQRKKFLDYCENVRNKITLDPYCVHIIISPSHFSSKMFCNAINEFVFDSKAHVISFDPQKEYRSNFETKYSNYAYFLEQNINSNGKLLFYYLDDQIITGSTFYRMNSLVKNLFMNAAGEDGDNGKIKIWNGIFTVVNRNSKSTIRDYIDDEQHYYPLFNIAVPSVRSNADSCPLCKMRVAADSAIRKSVLDCNASHWMEKKYWRRIRTLGDAKEDREKAQGKDKPAEDKLIERRFRRFYCENEFTKALSKNNNDVEGDIVKTLKTICSKNNQCEYLISSIKAISRPFLYYRETVKRATLKILIGLTECLMNCGHGLKNKKLYSSIKINFQSKIEKYNLLVILINSLASINSTYLFHEGKIDELVAFVKGLFSKQDCKKVLSFSESGKVEVKRNKESIISESTKVDESKIIVDSFYTVILNAVKCIILGIGGKEKSQKVDELISVDKLSGDLKELYKAIFLENSVKEKPLTDNYFESIVDEDNLVAKYKKIANEIRADIDLSSYKEEIDIEFFYLNESLTKKANDFNVFKIAENAEIISLCELFKEDNKDNIYNELNTIGYFEKDDKFLFKLHHYTEEGIEEEITKKEKQKEKLEEEVYILINFNGDRNYSIDRLKAIREILKYRYFLTEKISRDIRSGAIKTAIQAEGLGAYIGNNKVTSHGGSADLELLFSRICDDLLEEQGNKPRGYELLNIFMNHCISLGAAREYFFKYFSVEKKDDPFMAKLCFCPENSENIVITDYFKYIAENGELKLKFYWNGKENELENFCKEIKILNLYPKLIDLPWEDVGVHQIFLLGFIYTAIKNATEHGLKDENGKQLIEIHVKTQKEGVNLYGYNFEFRNKKSAEHENRDKLLSGLTKMFFCDFLNRKYLAEGSSGYFIQMGSDPEDKDYYRIKITVNGEKND